MNTLAFWLPLLFLFASALVGTILKRRAKDHCLKKFEVDGKKNGYPICMNAVYKKRGFEPPPNAARNCKLVFNKNVLL